MIMMPISAYKTSPSLPPTLQTHSLSFTSKTAMNPRINSYVLCSLFLLMFINTGSIECFGIGIKTFTSPHHKEKVRSRKLLGYNVVLDYDYAGPNPKHEPRGKKGGGGGTKNNP